MVQVSRDDFERLITAALDSLPGEHVKRIENIAITWEDDPSPEQRLQLRLRNDQTLFGLYEGVPLPQRQGMTRVVPDKITLFKHPLENSSGTVAGLQEQIRHTLWHEIGHYYGLDHDRIHKLE